MLSVPKEIRKSQSGVPSSSSAIRIGSFAKVADSIQGLQLNLDDVTIEEIIEVDEKAKQVIETLALLRDSLATLDEIKRSLGRVKAAVEAGAGENLEAAKIEVKKLSQSHATGPTSNLIVFPGAHKFSTDLDVRISTDLLSKENDVRARHPYEAQASTAQETRSAARRAANADSKAGRGSATSEPTQEITAVLPLEVNAQGETAASHGGSLRQQEAMLSQQPDDQKTTEPEFPRQEELEPRPGDTIFTLDMLEDGAASDTFDRAVPMGSEANVPAVADPAKAKREKPLNAEFDKALLESLIKDYGEFTTYANLAPSPEPPQPAVRPEIQDSPKIAEPVIRTEPAATKAVARPRNHGDLDRQLKKLIRDYGEYDLYSHRNQGNLKKGVIGAFLVLGMIFFGFYYVSSRHVAGQSTRNSTSEQGTFRPTGDTSDAAKPAGSVALPSEAEAGDSRESADAKSPERTQ